MVDDAAVATFKEFTAKSQAQDWIGEATLAEQQKTERPEWLAPYFAASEAYSNLCQKDKALKNLEYFVEKARNVNSFEKAMSSAEQNLSGMKAGHWPNSCN